MPENVIELGIKVNSETGQLEIVGQKLAETAKKAEQTGQSFLGLSDVSQKLAKDFLSVGTAYKIITFFQDSIREAEKENEVLRRLSFNLNNAGVSFKNSEQKINEWANAVQASTRFSDTQALETLERFVRVTGDLGKAQSLAKLAMDMSTASGKGLAEVEGLLADLANGNTRALITLNREFGGFTGGAKDAQVVLDNLQKSFSGASEKEESFTKSTSQLANSWNNFKEDIGRAIIPYMDALANALKNFKPFIEQIATSIAVFSLTTMERISTLAKAAMQLAKGHISEATQIYVEGNYRIFSIEQDGKRQIEEIERSKTLTVKTQVNERIIAKKKAVENEINQEKNKEEKIHSTKTKYQEKEKKDERDKNEIFKKARSESLNDVVENLRFLSEQQKIGKDAFKTVAIAQTLISTYEGAQHTYTSLAKIPVVGPILGAAAAAVAVAAGMARVALISSMHTGGEVGGSGDVPINAQGGEFVIRKDVAQKNRGFLQRLNSGESLTGLGEAPIYVNVSVSTNSLDLSNGDLVLKILAEEIGKQTANAVRFSNAVLNSTNRNSYLA